MRVAIVIVAILVGCAHYGGRPMRQLQARTTDLEVGMTSTQVEAIFGPPDSKEGSMCGRLTNNPWKCIRWVYQSDNAYLPLHVTFQQTNGALYVNNWGFTEF